MTQDTVDQIWKSALDGDMFAQAIMGLWACEGRFIEKNAPFGISILNELSVASAWGQDILRYISSHPNDDHVLEHIELSRQACSQIKKAACNNKYALTALGLIRYSEKDTSFAKDEGKMLITKAAGQGCLWARHLLQEIKDNEMAPVESYHFIFNSKDTSPSRQTNKLHLAKPIQNNMNRQNTCVVVGNHPRTEKFHYLENFHNNIVRKSKYGISLFECEKAIDEACRFFKIPVPLLAKDLTDCLFSNTMFYNKSSNSGSYADDILTYNMEQLKQLGVDSMDAFSLIMTHECAHRVLQNTPIPGLDNGRWEEELCCDFFMGVRCGLDKLNFDALDKLRKCLQKSPGAVTHPTGKLRYEVISYAITYVGYMDLIHNKRRSIAEYLQIFETWRQKHADEIKQAQIPFYGT